MSRFQDRDWSDCKFTKNSRVTVRGGSTIWRVTFVAKKHGGDVNYYHCEAPGYGSCHAYEYDMRSSTAPLSNGRPTRDRGVYVAGRLDNIEHVREAQAIARQAGCVITYDWTSHGSVADKPELWYEASEAEIRAALSCRLLIAMLPGGRGTHCEIGIALGSEWCERVVLVGAERTDFCLFYKASKVDHISLDSDWQRELLRICGEH